MCPILLCHLRCPSGSLCVTNLLHSYDECATPAVLSAASDEETEKEGNQGGSVHSSDDLEISAEMVMHHF